MLLEAYHSRMVSVAPMPAQQTLMPARSPSYAVRFALLMGPSVQVVEMLLPERWLIWWSLLISGRRVSNPSLFLVGGVAARCDAHRTHATSWQSLGSDTWR